MSHCLLKAYLKNVFLKPRPSEWFVYLLLFMLGFMFEISGFIHKSLDLAKVATFFWGFAVLHAILQVVKTNYKYYKTFAHGKSTVPDAIEEIKPKVSPDIWTFMEDLTERVERIEKQHSPYLTLLLTFLLWVGLAIAIPLVFRLLRLL